MRNAFRISAISAILLAVSIPAAAETKGLTIRAPEASCPQEPPSLAAVSSWLNGIETMEAGFEQVNADGTIDTRSLAIRRPGKMRIECETQDALMLVSSGSITLFDGARDKHSERYSLNMTPLWHLLYDNVDLGREDFVKQFTREGGAPQVFSWDDERPEAGKIAFEFQNAEDGSVTLAGWQIQNVSSEVVTVSLEEPIFGVELPLSEMSIIHETQRRKNAR